MIGSRPFTCGVSFIKKVHRESGYMGQIQKYPLRDGTEFDNFYSHIFKQFGHNTVIHYFYVHVGSTQ